MEQEEYARDAAGSCQAGEHHDHHHDHDDPARTHDGAAGTAVTKSPLASTPEKEAQPSATQTIACKSGCQHDHSAHAGTPAAAAPSGGCGHGHDHHHHHGRKWDWDKTMELRAFVFARDLFRRFKLSLRDFLSKIAKTLGPKPKSP